MTAARRFWPPLLSLLLTGGLAFGQGNLTVAESVAPEPNALQRAFAVTPVGSVVVRIGDAPGNEVFVAMRVDTPPGRLRQMLVEVENYRRAVPSLVRVDVSTKAVDWELEIPAANLQGAFRLASTAETVSLVLQRGAFAPGRLDFQVHPIGKHSILTLKMTVNARDANWITRRLVDREQLATPAITVTAAVVVLRAMAILAAPDETRSVRRPFIEPQPPLPAWLQTADLVDITGILGNTVPTGLVQVAPGGRLLFAQIGWQVPDSAESLSTFLSDAQSWKAVPGWKRITTSPKVETVGVGAAQRWSIGSSFPFVSFDGIWDVGHGKTLRGVCSEGEGKGAVWGWDAVPQGDGSFVSFSMHPRLDRLGYLPRKFIEAEPLLEHGLSMGLAYVDAIALLRTRPPFATQPAPTHHHGRAIAPTMSHEGAGWLTRPTRQAEEHPDTLHALLGLKKGTTACDIGAGNGYHSLKMASSVGPKGRVYSVDIQPEMLELLKTRATRAGILNITPVRGTEKHTGLPARICDLTLLVDVYHELSHPTEMLREFHRSISPQGRLVLVEFRAEDPKVPIKALHKMSRAQILKELNAGGFVLESEDHRLPWQHLMFFKADRRTHNSQ
ncbi:MAG: methyltransferase domain-containing protein [Deltaproteobacteria bacterium]|nr:methyltransferase domain-containing protein [Deltaproteobacteria bacterium]